MLSAGYLPVTSSNVECIISFVVLSCAKPCFKSQSERLYYTLNIYIIIFVLYAEQAAICLKGTTAITRGINGLHADKVVSFAHLQGRGWIATTSSFVLDMLCGVNAL